jgi:predicted glutamine amidotransferase
MCGIIGANVCSKTSSSEIIKSVKKLLFTSARRGKDAWGLTFLVKKKNLYLFKTFKSSQSIFETFDDSGLMDFVNLNHKNSSRVLYVLGHTRMATNGDVLNKNNQPLVSKDKNQVLVFNGIITNSEKLLKKKKVLSNNDGESLWFRDEFNNKYQGNFSYIKLRKYKQNIELIYETNNGSLYFSNEKFNGLKNILLSEESFFTKNKINGPEKINLNFIYKKKLISFNNFEKFRENSTIFLNVDTKKNSNNLVIPLENKTLSKSLLKKIDKRIDYVNSQIFRCKKCILTNTHPFITFDENGICNFCRSENIKKLINKKHFEKMIYQVVNKYGEDKILCSLSGGRDSSYALHLLVKDYGIKPLTYTYDWGVNTDIARNNVAILTGEFGLENILISADIRQKRINIQKNILAWIKKPHVGMVPLFMAGDKQFISNLSILKKEKNTKLEILSANLIENTRFKEELSGFRMWNLNADNKYGFELNYVNKLKLLSFYGKQFVLNPSYLNSSIFDSLRGFINYYNHGVKPLNIYEYIDWNEDEIETTLKKYNWQFANDTKTSWRIGDGTSPFYNLIYLLYTGFTENDVIRSNMIRRKKLSREVALTKVKSENQIRYSTLIWYLKILNLDPNLILNTIVKKSWNSVII